MAVLPAAFTVDDREWQSKNLEGMIATMAGCTHWWEPMQVWSGESVGASSRPSGWKV